MVAEFFADDDEETRDGVDEAVNGIRRDSERVGEEPDDNIENAEEKIGGDETISAFFDGLAAWGFGRLG